MSHINILIYRYPADARYSVFEDDRDFDGIATDYEVEMSAGAPAIAETRSHRRHEWIDGQCKRLPTLWTVFDVNTCDRVSFVHLSLDGKPTTLEPMQTGRILQVIMTPEKMTLSWPTLSAHALKEGDMREDYSVAKVEKVQPDHGWTVHVVWCAPTPVIEPELAGAR